MSTSGGNWKALFKASHEGDIPLIKYYLRGNDVDHKKSDGDDVEGERHPSDASDNVSSTSTLASVDPNFQHPEYFTSPVFECIRCGHVDALQLLVEMGGGSLTQREDATGKTPLEAAVDEHQHDIIDWILCNGTHLLDRNKYIRPYVRNILVIVLHYDMNLVKNVLRDLLDRGNKVTVIVDVGTESSSSQEPSKSQSFSVWDDLQSELLDLTGNKKILIIPSSSTDSTTESRSLVDNADTVLYYGFPPSSPALPEFMSALASHPLPVRMDDKSLSDHSTRTYANGIPSSSSNDGTIITNRRFIVVFDPSTTNHDVVSDFLLSSSNNSNKDQWSAIPLRTFQSTSIVSSLLAAPWRLWYEWTRSIWWWNTWVETVVWMATMNDDDYGNKAYQQYFGDGKIHQYNSSQIYWKGTRSIAEQDALF